MNNFKKYLLMTSFLVVIFGTFIYFIATPKEEMSYFENRALAKLPEYEKEKFLSGELMKEYETYFVDHFPKRDEFVKGYKTYELGSPKVFIDGKYHVTEDDWILNKPENQFSKEEMSESAKSVSDFVKHTTSLGIETHYISFPDKMNTISFKFPNIVDEGVLIEKRDFFYSQLSEEVKVLKVGEILKSKLSQQEIDGLYFKTDHHWNMDGAYAAYKELVSYLNVDEEGITDLYERVCLDASEVKFYGSWNKQLFGMVNTETEQLCHYNPTSEKTDFYKSKIYFGLQTEHETEWEWIYGKGLKKLEEKTIDYGELYTGDLDSFRIVNERNSDKEKILVIKDSYTNPMVGQLSNHFKEMVVFDVRHNEEGVLMKLLEDEHFDKVLIMYNDKNLNGDTYEFN